MTDGGLPENQRVALETLDQNLGVATAAGISTQSTLTSEEAHRALEALTDRGVVTSEVVTTAGGGSVEAYRLPDQELTTEEHAMNARPLLPGDPARFEEAARWLLWKARDEVAAASDDRRGGTAREIGIESAILHTGEGSGPAVLRVLQEPEEFDAAAAVIIECGDVDAPDEMVVTLDEGAVRNLATDFDAAAPDPEPQECPECGQKLPAPCGCDA